VLFADGGGVTDVLGGQAAGGFGVAFAHCMEDSVVVASQSWSFGSGFVRLVHIGAGKYRMPLTTLPVFVHRRYAYCRVVCTVAENRVAWPTRGM
jgi:hypothetical protein